MLEKLGEIEPLAMCETCWAACYTHICLVHSVTPQPRSSLRFFLRSFTPNKQSKTKLSGWWRHCMNPLPSVSCRRRAAGPHHSPCEPRTLCTWSMLVSHRWGSRCWSSPPHAGHTSAAVALFWAGVACRVKTEIDLWYDVKVKDLHW